MAINNQHAAYSKRIHIPLVDATTMVMSPKPIKNVTAATSSENLYHDGGFRSRSTVFSNQASWFSFGGGRHAIKKRHSLRRFHAKNHANRATTRNTSDFVAATSADAASAKIKQQTAHPATRCASCSSALFNSMTCCCA